MPATVTLKHVALSTGLSVPTVSEVLNEKAGFNHETRRRVMAAAAELGYRPNGSARATRSGRFGGVSLLLSTQEYRSNLPEGLLRGINIALVERDLHLSLAMLPDAKLTSEGFVPKLLRQTMSDGLLINYTDHIPAAMVDLIHRYDIPSVWINAKRPADCVRPDDFAGGRRATEHLLERGHRRIAYADFLHRPGSPEAHYSVDDRRAGYEAAMRDAGLAPRLLLRTEKRPTDEPRRVARAALSEPGRPTAVLGYAAEWVNVVASEAVAMGLRVPADLTAVTFSSGPCTVGFLPASTMLAPDAEVGRAAVEMLAEKIKHPAVEWPCRAIPFEFGPGDTIAAPADVS